MVGGTNLGGKIIINKENISVNGNFLQYSLAS